MVRRIAVTVILVYLLPLMLLFCFQERCSVPENTEIMPQISENEDADILVSVLGEDEKMNLEEYILRVTLAEMPADFELEALKAQAVVARTYTCRKMTEPKHSGGAVCTDAACCQAYITAEDYLLSGGSWEAVEKVKNAVDATAGQVLIYQGEYIEATYFSCSGGRTEDAQAVWGNAVPYLQSVDSPGEEGAAHYTDTVSISKADFLEKLGLPMQTVKIGAVRYSEGGGVSSIELCGKTFSGTDVRKKLSLRSTVFVITAVGDTVTVTTRGFGHRVGMSQYGADAMALSGKTYVDILMHYYTGTELSAVSG